MRLTTLVAETHPLQHFPHPHLAEAPEAGHHLGQGAKRPSSLSQSEGARRLPEHQLHLSLLRSRRSSSPWVDGQSRHPFFAEALRPGADAHGAHSQELPHFPTRLPLAEVPEACCLHPYVGLLSPAHQRPQFLALLFAELQHGSPPEAMLPQIPVMCKLFSLTP